MFQWLMRGGLRSRWAASEFSVLPALAAADSQELRDFCLLAGGLALVLSRCSARGAQRSFPATLATYRSVKRQLRRGRGVTVASQLLSDASHEVAQFADTATREALRRCLQRNLRAGAAAPQRLRAA